MYTNLDNDFGREAINFWLEKDPDGLPRNILKEFVPDALGVVLECNVFFFNNKYYLQIKGSAMGTKVAPTYAALVMAYLELRLYEKIEEKFGQEFRKEFEEQWGRYLDDCFINWDTTFAEVTDLHNTLNSLQRGIEFTMEANPTKNTFLQILLMVKGTRITKDIFYKPTDTFQYLPFTSCHPVHTKKNVPSI